MWMHVCIPTSIFKHTAVGTPAQTSHAIQLEREIQGLETESDGLPTVVKFALPFQYARGQKSQMKYGKDLWNHVSMRLLTNAALFLFWL